MNKLIRYDVKVNVKDGLISISHVDPSGFFVDKSCFIKDSEDDVIGVSLDVLQDLVVWVFNLGYGKGLKEGN